MTRAYHHAADIHQPDHMNRQVYDTTGEFADTRQATSDAPENRGELKARAAAQRAELVAIEEAATSCAPTMRTIRLCDNSAYDSNCPTVWAAAHAMGCVIR